MLYASRTHRVSILDPRKIEFHSTKREPTDTCTQLKVTLHNVVSVEKESPALKTCMKKKNHDAVLILLTYMRSGG